MVWTDTSSAGSREGVFGNIYQNGDGGIRGDYWASNSANQCYDSYAFTGSALGGGDFSVSASDTSTPQSKYCAVSFTAKIAVSGAACSTATMTWNNSSGDYGTDLLALNNPDVVVPTAEAQPIFDHFLSNQPALGLFDQALQPMTYNFTGRLVSETLDGYQDGCTGGASNPIVPPPAAAKNVPVTVLSDTVDAQIPGSANNVTSGYSDQVGFQDVQTVDIIRASGDPLPCSITVQQQLMTMNTTTGSYQYQLNTLGVTVNTNSLIVARGPPGSETVKERYLPSISAVIVAPIDLIILDAALQK